jgi:glutamate--cysteine ligase
MPTDRPTLTLDEVHALVVDAGFERHPPAVGLELEWFVSNAGRRVDAIDTIRRPIEADGPLPRASRVTFEPGGQLEISTLPAPDGPTALADAAIDADEATDRLADAGLDLTAIGLDPNGPASRILDAPRYAAMERYFADRGHRGSTMMCGTASMQVNVGWADDPDSQWHDAHDLAPVLAAMFAHSPLYAGRPSGWQSSRLAVWAALDPPRTRPVPASPSPAEAWATYALDAPVMAVPTDAETWQVPSPPITLREWVTLGAPGGHPDSDDVRFHLTTLFPPIRPRGWLELRVLDALPDPWWRVAAAVSIVTLTHPALRRRLTEVLRPVRGRWLEAAWRGVHDPAIGGAATCVLDLALPVIADAGFDAKTVLATEEFADRYTRRGRSLADDRLDEWARFGHLPVRTPARAAI